MLHRLTVGIGRRHVRQHARTFSRTAALQVEDLRAAHMPGNTTTQLNFMSSVLPEGERIPSYRVLDGTGNVIEGAELPDVSV
jgi:2-oxoisovalerate dehydrogenase E1 component alpha subunit